MNTEYKLLKMKDLDVLTVGEHFTLNRTSEVQAPGGFLQNVLQFNPSLPVYTTKGEFAGPVGGYPDRENPVARLERNKDNRYTYWRLFGDAYLDVNPMKTIEPVANTLFITRFKEVVESHLDDSELSVEDLAAQMNLSRVQLYRKVKAVTGSTPIELLRTARLNRAYQLLLTTDKSVSEVAYQVGFTAPSYFTKCFKDEYGMLPGDIKK